MPRRREPPVPKQRTATVREQIRAALIDGPMTTLEISHVVGISEREAESHLEHLAQSLRRGPERFQIEPASCPDCGFEFKDRKKLTRPSRCPKCRGERIERARFWVASQPSSST